MTSLVLGLLLTATPAAPAGIRLQSGMPRAATLLAQVAPLPPPPPLPPLMAPDTAARIAELQADIDELSARLFKLPSRFWPAYSVTLSVLGGLALGVAGVVLVVVRWVSLPVPWVALAVVGLTALLVGIATGVTTVATADAERQRLLEQRDALERELRILRRTGALHDEVLVPIARF